MILFIWLASSIAPAADLVVGPGGFESVAAALDAAAPGDRIQIDLAEIREAVVVDREVQIVAGPQGVLWRPPDPSPDRLLMMNEAAVALVGLSFDGEGRVGIAEVTGGSLVLDEVVATDTLATEGGAILGFDAEIVVSRSTLSTGTALAAGGMIAVTYSALTIEDSTLSDGTAASGAAIYASASDVTVIDSTLSRNNAARNAAIEVAGGGLQVVRSLLCENTSSAEHIIRVTNTEALFANNLFLDNLVVFGHGVLDVAENDITAVHNAFVGNVTGAGGATMSVYGYATHVTFEHNLVWRNVGGTDALFSLVQAAPDQIEGGYNLYYDNLGEETDAPLTEDWLGTDPLLPEATFCGTEGLWPPADSPLVDGGDPDQIDRDGTIADIGVFGGLEAFAAPETETEPEVPVDADQDGWPVGEDCDDTDARIHPGATELPCDAMDNDCDPASLDDPDGDGDGVGRCLADCDDTDPQIHTGAREIADDGVDQDCDGVDLVTALQGPSGWTCRTPTGGRGGWIWLWFLVWTGITPRRVSMAADRR